MIRKSWIKQGILCLGVFLALISAGKATELLFLSTHTNAGEHNQVLGVRRAVERAHPGIVAKDLNLEEVNPEGVRGRVQDALSRGKVIVVAAGESGVEGIQQCPNDPHLTICLMSHMVLEGYQNPEVLQKATFVALPTHAVSPEIRAKLGGKLIETVGVAHNRQREDVEEVYKRWGKMNLPEASRYVVVILGGDAPSPGSKINKFFTKKDAEKLADYVAREKKPEESVIVLNGPRTGKFNSKQQEDKTVHRKGNSDPITGHFVKCLGQKGIQFKLFDFQHKEPGNEQHVLPFNSFDLALGAVCAQGGRVLVPGESTSMISEARDLLGRGQVMVYENGAMSDVHFDHVGSEQAAGKVSVLKEYSKVVPLSAQAEGGGQKGSAAETIAERLLK